jgi:WD40 repeat protein
MKKINSLIAAFLISLSAFAQAPTMPSTDIFLMSMSLKDGNYVFGKPLNITDREGYDNQPSFISNGKKILYSSMRDNVQTDIFIYNIKDSTTTQMTKTSNSEYSPVMMADGSKMTVVRVDDDKAQRLYYIDLRSEEDEPNQVLSFQDSVAYYAWLDTANVACAMLNGKQMDLEIFDIPSMQFIKLMSNVGRCMMNIPGTDEFSFTQKTSDSTATIFRYNNKTSDMMPICQLPDHCEDYAYTAEGKLITGKEGKLLIYDESTEKPGWNEIADFSKTVGKFYRIAVSPKGDKIALVAYIEKEKEKDKDKETVKDKDKETPKDAPKEKEKDKKK